MTWAVGQSSLQWGPGLFYQQHQLTNQLRKRLPTMTMLNVQNIKCAVHCDTENKRIFNVWQQLFFHDNLTFESLNANYSIPTGAFHLPKNIHLAHYHRSSS